MIPSAANNSIINRDKRTALYYNGRMAVIIDSLKDTVKDTITLIPFLFITYLAMEWLEDKTEDQSVAMLSRINRLSHVLGAGI